MPRCGDTFEERPPLDKGDFRGVLGATHNLVWVVDRGTHPGAARPRGVFSRLHLRATPPTERIFISRRNVSFSERADGSWESSAP